MGGSSKSENTNITETHSVQANIQGSAGHAIVGDGNTILDGGAIAAMREVAGDAAALASQNILSNAALTEKLAKLTSDSSARHLAEALGFSQRASSEAMSYMATLARPDLATNSEQLKYLALVGVGVAGLLILKGGKF